MLNGESYVVSLLCPATYCAGVSFGGGMKLFAIIRWEYETFCYHSMGV